jgi:RNA polymerase sigma factor (TIGR02999 family)
MGTEDPALPQNGSAEGAEQAPPLLDTARLTADELFPLVYEELRILARSYKRQASPGSVQPTSLVHAAYLRLARGEQRWKDQSHFRAVAAIAMRQVLTDRARRGRAAKRGGDWRRVSLTDIGRPEVSVDLVDLDDALTKLERLDPRSAQVVHLRFFGGLTVQETAKVLGVSTRTVEKDWRRSRAWLSVELEGSDR